MPDDFDQLHALHRAEQTRFAYFKLAAAASGIGLAINQTSGAQFDCAMLILGAAVVAWLCSFLSGCLFVGKRISGLALNAELANAKKGRGLIREIDARVHSEAIELLRSGWKELDDNAADHGTAQFRFLIVGALFYLAWHVVGIALRTVSAA